MQQFFSNKHLFSLDFKYSIELQHSSTAYGAYTGKGEICCIKRNQPILCSNISTLYTSWFVCLFFFPPQMNTSWFAPNFRLQCFAPGFLRKVYISYCEIFLLILIICFNVPKYSETGLEHFKSLFMPFQADAKSCFKELLPLLCGQSGKKYPLKFGLVLCLHKNFKTT